MTEEQSGLIVAADGDLRDIVGGHEIRLAAVERRQDATDGKLDGISKDLATMRAEENARTVATTAGISRLEVRVFDLVTQLAKLTGAQENQNGLLKKICGAGEHDQSLSGLFAPLLRQRAARSFPAKPGMTTCLATLVSCIVTIFQPLRLSLNRKTLP
ncbi:hypothetical protein, partial [Acetobacter malorum]|uniref:hypothetical protein n=1 Tax=Acetobacter malorum TaxID=178901 RepID=UPI0018D2D2A5